MTKFIDKVAISGTRIRDDGYLVADAKVARTGIQLYAGHEVGKPDQMVVKVFRPADEVFSQDTLASFAHRPVTNDHPDVAVDASNWKQYAVGNTADEVARDGQFIRVPLMVSDASAIADIQSGKRELSAGYSADLDWTPGITPDGESYDAVQRKIRDNHIAIVAKGRAGSEVRIPDSITNWGALGTPIIHLQKDTAMTKKIMFDGIEIEVTDQGAQAITKLQALLDAATGKLATMETANVAALTAKDTEIAKKDAEIDALKGKVLDGAALDKAVTDRADLLAVAKAIVPDVETTGLSAADIRKAVVSKKLGDAAIAGKSEAYIDARFDILAEDAKAGSNLTHSLSTITPAPNGHAAQDKAWNDSITDMNAWRNKTA